MPLIETREEMPEAGRTLRRTKAKGPLRGTRGAVAVEGVLLVLPLLVLLFAIIDFGRYMWMRHVVTEAAAEGGRMALLHVEEASDADVESTVLAFLADGQIELPATVSVGARSPSSPVSVDVTVTGFQFLLLSLLPGLPDTVNGGAFTAGSAVIAER